MTVKILINCHRLKVASYYGLPVSMTHCIIGAMVGFGLVNGRVGVVNWSSLARVVSSWVILPMIGAAISFVVYKCIIRFVYIAPSPGQAAVKAAPIAVFAFHIAGSSKFRSWKIGKSFAFHIVFQVASYHGLPVSMTHCIIGAMVGFVLVYGRVGVVNWSSLARVVS